jgi:uncharacterized protein YebE (UPF0316 family)
MGPDGTLLGSVGLPLVIFLAEMLVVTVSTLRIIVVSRSLRLLASFLGLVEISVWLFAIGQVMQNLNNVACSASFAAGFTLGNYLGITLESKMAMGSVIVRLITRRDATALAESLRAANYGITLVEGQGATGRVQIILAVIPRRELNAVVGRIKEFDAGAFYSVDMLQTTAAGIYPLARRQLRPIQSAPEPCELASVV